MSIGEKKVYIHYGSSEFDKEKFVPIRNGHLESKPYGGLWASPADSKYGWKDWCENEGFRLDDLSSSFSFVLSDDSRVLRLRSGKDVDKLPRYNWKCFSGGPEFMHIDFEALMKDYDAVEVHLSEEGLCEYSNSLYWTMYSWDCDSILIMNPDVVIPVSGNEFKIDKDRKVVLDQLIEKFKSAFTPFIDDIKNLTNTDEREYMEEQLDEYFDTLPDPFN